MSEKASPEGEVAHATVSDSAVSPEDTSVAKPQTPKRRMTPIYDDYQTAVSMIRSGTPKLPSPTTPPAAADENASKSGGDLLDLPKTPNRRFSYSMTDVHRKLAETYGDLQSALANPDQTITHSATTRLPAEGERRVSIPVFPLHDRDSDDENERLVFRGERPSEESEVNPAGVQLGDHDIPLRDMELAQVRSRTRGEPVSSREIQASSAEFEYADESNIGALEPATSVSARVSGSAATEASTVGNIVDHYQSGYDEEASDSYDSVRAGASSTDPAGGYNMRRDQLYGDTPQTKTRGADVVGPPPSWPLPSPPPALPPRSSKRRNSSGMLSSPGTYGNTSGLLNTNLLEHSNVHMNSSRLLNSGPSSEGALPLKLSRSSDDLVFGGGDEFRASDMNGGKGMGITRLSHVSEESSRQSSSDSGWLNAIGYAGKKSQNQGSYDLGTGTVGYAGEVQPPTSTLGEVETATGWSPGHGRADNVFYPSGLITRDMRRRGGMDRGAGTRFGSLDQILAGRVDTDDETLDSVDDADWETINESRSRSNLQYDGSQKDDLQVIESAKLSSFSSLSLKHAPVSTWDPLSNKTPGFERSEKELEESLKSHKESKQDKQVEEIERLGANNSIWAARAEQARLLPVPASADNTLPRTSQEHIPKTLQVNKPKPAAQARYRHPTPLEPEHAHPFAGIRPVLPPLTKTQSTSSSDTMANQMYNQVNRNIESTSSLAAQSSDNVSAASRDEENERQRVEHNRSIEAEARLYDPGKSTPYTLCSVDQTKLTLLQIALVYSVPFQKLALPSIDVFA